MADNAGAKAGARRRESGQILHVTFRAAVTL
jgi:hypothetical protein